MTTVLTAVPGSPPWDLPHPEARIRVAPGLWVGMGSPKQPSGGKAAWAPLLDASPVGMASFLRRSPWCPGLCRRSPRRMPLPDRAPCRRRDKQLVQNIPRPTPHFQRGSQASFQFSSSQAASGSRPPPPAGVTFYPLSSCVTPSQHLLHPAWFYSSGVAVAATSNETVSSPRPGTRPQLCVYPRTCRLFWQ